LRLSTFVFAIYKQVTSCIKVKTLNHGNKRENNKIVVVSFSLNRGINIAF